MLSLITYSPITWMLRSEMLLCTSQMEFLMWTYTYNVHMHLSQKIWNNNIWNFLKHFATSDIKNQTSFISKSSHFQ